MVEERQRASVGQPLQPVPLREEVGRDHQLVENRRTADVDQVRDLDVAGEQVRECEPRQHGTAGDLTHARSPRP